MHNTPSASGSVGLSWENYPDLIIFSLSNSTVCKCQICLKNFTYLETRVTLRSYNCFYILSVYDSSYTHDPAWLNKFTWSLLTFCLNIVANSPPIYQTSKLLTTLNLCVIKHWEQNLQISCTYQFCRALGTTYITPQAERKIGVFCFFF